MNPSSKAREAKNPTYLFAHGVESGERRLRSLKILGLLPVVSALPAEEGPEGRGGGGPGGGGGIVVVGGTARNARFKGSGCKHKIEDKSLAGCRLQGSGFTDLSFYCPGLRRTWLSLRYLLCRSLYTGRLNSDF